MILEEPEPETTLLRRAREAAGLTQGEVRRRLAKARERRGKMPPKDASLKRMYTSWEKVGGVKPTDWIDELCEVFELPPSALIEGASGGPFTPIAPATQPSLLAVKSLDPAVIQLLEQQTDLYRMQDRVMGSAIIPQTEAHVANISGMLRNALPGKHAQAAGVALAEAAALAGWQALDAGNQQRSWDLHDIAKAAARESDNPTVYVHVAAQQAYALLDAQRPDDAVAVLNYVNSRENTTHVPPRLRAWLAAAHAEFLAAAGQRTQALRMLDLATDILPTGDSDPELPYLMLNQANLARWRGHCLARLGEDEAIADLNSALDGLASMTSRRAETGLRVDLALALQRKGDGHAARIEAQRAAELAGSTGSARQRARITRLLAS
ncbi:hypothetical protein [Amycolatopsis orientalis]|uniref:hypothetical protein n=1 Tax=Amycolatopsis orientalis TaxID=31958 RepID=UPI001F1C06D1|nr:hypothetical protein [Amycolatopsis orientalis]